MADDFAVTAGAGTTIRAVEKSSKKTQVVAIDLGGAGAESLLTTMLPVSLAAGTAEIGNVKNAGTFAVQAVTTVADAADVAQGALADAVVNAGATGSISAKLRRITTDLDALLTELKVKADPTESQQTKGVAFSIPVILTVTNGAYTIADVVGGLITFANACSAAGKAAIINTITLAGVVAIPYELWFFAADIATPAADNAAFTLVAADAAQCKGVVSIAAGDYNAAQSAFNIATLRGVGFQYSCTATTLYAYLKATAVTSPGTTTLTLTIKGEFID